MRIERSKVKCPSAGSLLNDFALHGLGFDALQYIVNFTQLVQCLAICNTVRSDDFLLQIQHAIAADAIDGPSAAASPTGTLAAGPAWGAAGSSEGCGMGESWVWDFGWNVKDLS